jgi:hypothetical protein
MDITHAVLFIYGARCNSNPSVCLRRQLPLLRGAKGMDIAHAVLFIYSTKLNSQH